MRGITLLALVALISLFFVEVSPRSKSDTQKYGGEVSGVAGDQKYTLKHDDLLREYLVHVPASYDKKKSTPLVIALHGGAADIANAPGYFGLNETADKEGFIVVYPQGTGKKYLGKTFGSWNAWRCCNPAKENNIDDVGFISRMIKEIKKNFTIDEKRVFVTGMSNGAQMAYRVGCELSDTVAAIAPVGSIDFREDCSGKQLVPLLHIQGMADKCSVWSGGTCGVCFDTFFKRIGFASASDNTRSCLAIETYVEKWRKKNLCSPEKTETYKNGGALCEKYAGCEADVVFCRVKDLGHAWPGQPENSAAACKTNPDGALCKAWVDEVEGTPNTDLLANEVLWEFFENHPMK